MEQKPHWFVAVMQAAVSSSFSSTGVWAAGVEGWESYSIWTSTDTSYDRDPALLPLVPRGSLLDSSTGSYSYAVPDELVGAVGSHDC